MGYDLLAAIFFVMLTPFVIAAFVTFWIVNALDYEALAASWRSYARTRELEFIGPEGEWPNRTAAAITWTDAGASFRFTTVGREAKVRTRLVVRPRATLLGSLVWVCEEGAAARVRTSQRPAGMGQRIVSERVRRALLALRQRDRVSLTYRRGRAVVEWPGGELNDARLDAARRLGEALVESVDEEFRKVAERQRPAA